MSEMLVLSLTMTILGSAISLLVGGVIGWIARQVTYENTPQTVYAHPEMFDQNGNLMPDEIVAVRFEKNDNNEETEEDDKSVYSYRGSPTKSFCI